MKVLMAIVVLFALSGCSSLNSPIVGGIVNQTKGPTAITANKMGSKMGKACASSVVGFAFGDTSITKAAKNGRIKKITHVDHEAMNILGIFVKYCTIVYGM